MAGFPEVASSFRCVPDNRLIDGDLRRDALALQRSKDWDDAGPQLAEAIGTESGGAATANSQVCGRRQEARLVQRGSDTRRSSHSCKVVTSDF